MTPRKKLSKIIRARELRKDSTGPEQILWESLKNREFFGLKFRRQHIFRGFIFDFYCSQHKLAIELDGSIHLKQKDYDIARQKLIEKFGIKVIRFKNDAVINDLAGVLRDISLSIVDGEGLLALN